MIRYMLLPSSALNIFILSVVVFMLVSCADINLHQTGYETAKQNCNEARQYRDYQACLAEVDRNYNQTTQ